MDSQIYTTVVRASEYEISNTGDIRRKDGRECTLTTVGNDKEPAIELEIYGSVRTCSLDWLRLMTHFEVDLPKRDFFRVRFTPCKKWKYGNTVARSMIFDGFHPIYKDGFRYVPEYLRYAINREGTVIDTYLQKTVHTHYNNVYPYINCYSADSKKIRKIPIHRLVALSWIPNANPLIYNIIDHIDANKFNPNSTNLEWVTHRENNDSAVALGLMKQAACCRVKNIETGEIIAFPSILKAYKYIGISKSPKHFLNPEKVIRGKYLIKLQSDKTEWTDKPTTGKAPHAKIVIYSGTEHIGTFNSYAHIYKHFNLTGWLPKSIRTFKQMVNINKWTVVEEYPAKQSIQVYDIKADEILSFSNMSTAAKVLNVPRCTIVSAIEKGERWAIKGYAYRIATDVKWDTNFISRENSPMCISAISSDGIVTTGLSLRGARQLTGLTRRAIRRILLGLSSPDKDWNFITQGN